MKQQRIEIIDTTLRDGQQSPLMFDTKKYYFTFEDKKKIVKSLILLGVKNIEFFAPNVSESEFEHFLELKKYIREIDEGKNIRLLAHCRCHETDIKMAIDAGFDGLNLYMGTSKESQTFNHKKNITELTYIVKDITKNLHKDYPEMYLRFSGEDAFRTDLKDLTTVFDSVTENVNTLGIPDTVGIASPDKVEQTIKFLRSTYSNELEIHFHNDRGYALINYLTAINHGVKYASSSIWGIAERSGIASLTGLLFNLYKENPNYVDGYNLNLCYPVNITLATILQRMVPYTEPVSLTNRTHTAGVHTNAILKDNSSYEANNLEKFGVNKNEILLGPMSGYNLIYYYLKEVQGYNLTIDQAKQLAKLFKIEIHSIQFNEDPSQILLRLADNYGISKEVLPHSIVAKRIEKL